MSDVFDSIEPEKNNNGDVFDSISPEVISKSSLDDLVSSETSKDLKTELSSIKKKIEDRDNARKEFIGKLLFELKDFIRLEVSKIRISQDIIERIVEKQPIIKNVYIPSPPVQIPAPPPQIIKEIKEVRVEVPTITPDTRKLVEEAALEVLKEEIDRLNKELKETRRIAESPIMGPVSPGGPGVIGIPDPNGQNGKVLKVEDNHPIWGTGSAAYLDDLLDVDDSARQAGFVLMFNGTEWVAAAQGTTFAFSISAFANGQSATVEIGVGVWKAAGALSFTASYSNGPADDADVSFAGWGGDLQLTNSFQGPTSNSEAVNFPSVGGTVTFTLQADKGAESDTEVIVHTFVNRRFWGVSSVTSGFTESDIEGLSNNELSNSKSKTFSLTAGSGEYIVFSYPTRLGTATFTVNGFEGGFESPETVSVTNASGYTEDYYVYRSVNSALGSTTVTVS